MQNCLLWHLFDDPILKEFFMSLSGTIIYGSEEGKVKIYNPLAKDRKVLKALLEGGKAEIYKCDNAEYIKCLKLTSTETEIKKEIAPLFIKSIKILIITLGIILLIFPNS